MIDDHEVSRFLMRHVLTMRGHLCEAVGTAAAGLGSIDNFKPEIVILEWSLRDRSGLGLARQLRSRSAAQGRSLTVVVVSTANEPAGFLDEEHVDAYFTKPISMGVVEEWFGSGMR